MNLFEQFGGLLQRYASGAHAQDNDGVENDYEQMAHNAPREHLSDGIASAFRSDQTPPFPSMLAQMFGNANPNQKAGMLNQLIAVAGPALLGSGMLGNLLGGRKEITPDQAEHIDPHQVEEMAREAEQKDPSVVDQISGFFANQPGLVKTLGGAALTIAMAKMAQRMFPR